MNKRLVIFTSCIILCLIGTFHLHQSMRSKETFSKATIRYGSQGADVRELQGRLKYLGYYKGRVDGDFGWSTFASLKHFQWRFGMRVDGIAGPKTKLKLWQATKRWRPEMTMDRPARTGGGGRAGRPALTNSNAMGLSANELRIIANAVHGEARGEPYIGQVAVAAVIFNRLSSPRFPNTINGVIFQPGAFTAVADGQIWLNPNETSKKAVRDALNGWDPTGGCIYYFNPATATNKWIWGRPQVKRIGKHIFCK